MSDSDNDGPKGEGSERRSIAGVLRSERRVTPRLAEPTLRMVFDQYLIICRIWTGFAILFILGEVISNFVLPETRWAKTLFFCTCAAVITFAAERVRSSVQSYLSSESVGKSVRIYQDVLVLVFVFVIIMIVMATTHLVNVY